MLGPSKRQSGAHYINKKETQTNTTEGCAAYLRWPGTKHADVHCRQRHLCNTLGHIGLVTLLYAEQEKEAVCSVWEMQPEGCKI